MLSRCEIALLLAPTTTFSVAFSLDSFGLLEDKNAFENGLDPAEYFRLKRIHRQKKRKKRRRMNGSKTDLAISASGSKRRTSSSASVPKVEFLIPETYETPPPECAGGDGLLSGVTFINFLVSAIAVAANLISNINSNQRNNNNNNNDNNDNVANFNFGNNNNGANNQNTIQICPFPCIPGPPPIPTGRRRRKRRKAYNTSSHEDNLKVASFVAKRIMENSTNTKTIHQQEDIYLAAMLAAKLFVNLKNDPSGAFCSLFSDLEGLEGSLDRAGVSLLTVLASRMAFYSDLRSDAMSCSQNMAVGNQTGATILPRAR